MSLSSSALALRALNTDSTPNGDFCRYVMLAKPGGVESVFKALKAHADELSDMGKVVEIVTAQGVQIAA